MANAQQIEHWNGETGRAWVRDGERYASMLGPFGDRVLETMAPRPGERILDVGCGNGDLSMDAARRVAPSGSVVGLDVSRPMLENAAARAASAALSNVEFREADAQVATFPAGSFDAACSRFGVMFFDDPVVAFANIRSALRPGGRLIFACWRDLVLNEYVMIPAAAALEHLPAPNVEALSGPGPYSLADPDQTRRVLRDAGYTEIDLAEIDEQILMGENPADVTRFFRGHEFAEILFDNAPPDAAERAWSAIEDALQLRATDEGIRLAGAAWIVTAHAPGECSSCDRGGRGVGDERCHR